MTVMINEAERKKSLDDYITQLWNCHAAQLRSYLRRNYATDDVEDLLQITFERLYRTLVSYPQEPFEARITNTWAYLVKIARNVTLRLLHQNHDALVVSADAVIDNEDHSLLDSLSDSSPSIEEVLLNREKIRNLREQIELLPERERVVLYYTYFDGRPPTDISAILGISPSAIRRTLIHAKNHLERNLSLKELKERDFSKKFTEPEQDSANNNSCPLDRDTLLPAVPELASQIAQLREPYCSVLTLAMLERRKYTQIAALRGCSLGTIKGQISRGIRLLQSVQQPVQFSVSLPSQTSIVPRELPYLDALPEKYCSILTLREIQGYSYAQIAAHLQITSSLVKKRLHCARVAYRALLDQQPCQLRMVPRRKTIPLDELSRLNHPAYRHFYETLQLAYVDHLSDEEIAARLHRPVNTIKAHIARGIKLLTPVEPPEEPERSLLMNA